MVVQHNLTAMNANRQLGITTGAQAKSSEKLSSGYKINRAADDAAGQVTIVILFTCNIYRTKVTILYRKKKNLFTICNYFLLSVNCGSI